MKLVAIDLDGTLLSEDGTISEVNKTAILEAQKQGCMIVISSGRSLHDIESILKSAEIDCPILAGNGALVFHEGSMIHSRVMSMDVVNELLAILKEENYYFELYTNRGVTLEEKGNTQLKEELSRLQETDDQFPSEWASRMIDIQFEQQGLQFINDFQNYDLENAGIYKVFVFSFDRQKLEQLKDKLNARTDISITTSGWTKLEIAHPEASKGKALEDIANTLGISIKDTVAIGDNFNDLSMFQKAGISIAMGNAEEEVKKQCTYSTLDCEENGVAYALRKYILKEK